MKSQGYYFFYDDNLVGNKKYMKELLKAFIDNDVVPYGWHSQMRADAALDSDLMELMQRTNCIAGTFGFESINDLALKNMQKSQDTDLIKTCVKTMHDYDILVNGFFVFGFDEDNVQTVRDTVEFAQNNYIDVAGFMPVTPFPGTVLGEELKPRTFSKNWELYDVQHVVYYPKKMTPFELYNETLKAYPRFYHPSKRKLVDSKTKNRGLFFQVMEAWPARAFQLYGMSLMANRRYIRYLKSLPEEPTEGIKDFLPENENMHLHNLLKIRYPMRNAKIVWGMTLPKKRKSKKKKSVTTRNQ